MISKRKWLKDSVDLARALIKQQWLPLLALFALTALLAINAEDIIAGTASSPSEENQRMTVNIIMAVWDLVEGLLTILILSWGVPQIRELGSKMFPKPFSEPYLGSFFAEYMRMMAYVLLWGILLLVPGFVAYCRYSFVPLIALFSKDYREGNANAIEVSKRLTRPYLWRIILAQLSTMALEAALEICPDMIPALHNVFVRLLCLIGTYALSVLMYSLIFVLFEYALENSEPA